jgi:hypothetical protein
VSPGLQRFLFIVYAHDIISQVGRGARKTKRSASGADMLCKVCGFSVPSTSIPLTLMLGYSKYVDLLAKLDTGGSYCMFNGSYSAFAQPPAPVFSHLTSFVISGIIEL